MSAIWFRYRAWIEHTDWHFRLWLATVLVPGYVPVNEVSYREGFAKCERALLWLAHSGALNDGRDHRKHIRDKLVTRQVSALIQFMWAVPKHFSLYDTLRDNIEATETEMRALFHNAPHNDVAVHHYPLPGEQANVR